MAPNRLVNLAWEGLSRGADIPVCLPGKNACPTMNQFPRPVYLEVG